MKLQQESALCTLKCEGKINSLLNTIYTKREYILSDQTWDIARLSKFCDIFKV